MLDSRPQLQRFCDQEQLFTSNSKHKIPMLLKEIRQDHLIQDSGDIISYFFSYKKEDVKLSQCTNGITNKLVKAVHQPSGHKILVRTYGRGSGLLIDRQQELTVLI